MAMSTCPKCNDHRFEIVETEPHSSRFKLLFVQCMGCGAVVGVLEYRNIGWLLDKIAAKLGIRLD